MLNTVVPPCTRLILDFSILQSSLLKLSIHFSNHLLELTVPIILLANIRGSRRATRPVVKLLAELECGSWTSFSAADKAGDGECVLHCVKVLKVVKWRFIHKLYGEGGLSRRAGCFNTHTHDPNESKCSVVVSALNKRQCYLFESGRVKPRYSLPIKVYSLP